VDERVLYVGSEELPVCIVGIFETEKQFELVFRLTCELEVVFKTAL
jgi:hypothetical protein